MSRIAVINRKGGIGKTKVAVNLSHALALRGRRVLAVDCDSQRSMSLHLMGGREVTGRKTIRSFLTAPIPNGSRFDPSPFITLTNVPRVDLIAGDRSLDEFEPSDPFPSILSLAARLDFIQNYDYVIFDTGPSWSLPTKMAFRGATDLIIPVMFENQSLQAVKDLHEDIIKLSREFAHHVRIRMVVPVGRDMRYAGRVHEVERELEKLYPKAKAPSIRTDGQLVNAGWRTIFQTNASARSAQDFRFLAAWLEGEEGA